MRAITFERYGPAEVLTLGERPAPEPGEYDVLVRVRAASLNSWDAEFTSGTTWVNRQMFGWRRPRKDKQIPGCDVAGVVERVGPRVTRFAPGDAVFGDLWDAFGAFAEFACGAETSFERITAGLTFREAAAVPQAGVLAWNGLALGGALGTESRVLVNGGGGGVGTFAIQLARAQGAHVTAVDNAHKQDAMRVLGADRVLDFAQRDFTDEDASYDLILDCLAHRPLRRIRRVLAHGGTYAIVGGKLRYLMPAMWIGRSRWLRGDRRYELVYVGPNKGLVELGERVARGELRPVIDSTFPLAETADAMRRFESGRFFGKIVIDVDAAGGSV